MYDSWAGGANCALQRVEHAGDLQVRAGEGVAVQLAPRDPFSRTFLRGRAGVTGGTDVNVERVATVGQRMRRRADQLRLRDGDARQPRDVLGAWRLAIALDG